MTYLDTDRNGVITYATELLRFFIGAAVARHHDDDSRKVNFSTEKKFAHQIFPINNNLLSELGIDMSPNVLSLLFTLDNNTTTLQDSYCLWLLLVCALFPFLIIITLYYYELRISTFNCSYLKSVVTSLTQ
jgi:hypothetical protein